MSPSATTRVDASSAAAAVARSRPSSSSASRMPRTWLSALWDILTMAVEISPLLAASSSLIAEKSLALPEIWLDSFPRCPPRCAVYWYDIVAALSWITARPGAAPNRELTLVR